MLFELGDQVREEGEAHLNGYKEKLLEDGYQVDTLVEEGESVAELILDASGRLGVDTIIMSTHARGGVSRWIFGSVADKVLQKANVPVLLVKEKAD
jgi:nucleotide-binding universal stress UspA family protein